MTGNREDRGPTAVVMPGSGVRTPSAAIAQRSEFVRAFVEYAGDKPASERLTVRWPTLITVTALVAVGAVVVGIFWNLIDPLQPGEKGARKKAVPKRGRHLRRRERGPAVGGLRVTGTGGRGLAVWAGATPVIRGLSVSRCQRTACTSGRTHTAGYSTRTCRAPTARRCTSERAPTRNSSAATCTTPMKT